MTVLGRLRNAAHDERGVSAVEFAFILPLLIALYIGVVEMGNLLTLSRRTSTVASTAADLIAQEKTTSNTALKDAMNAAKSILDPYPVTPLKIVLTSVLADQNNVGKVVWSCAYNGGAARGVNSTYPTPNGLTQANSSVVVAEISYDFKPLLSSPELSPAAFTMKHIFYARPRRSAQVTKTDVGCP
jgi:Flp pilus assembly protein TadG